MELSALPRCLSIDESGASAAEYAIVIALIVIVLLATVRLLGLQFSGSFGGVTQRLAEVSQTVYHAIL